MTREPTEMEMRVAVAMDPHSMNPANKGHHIMGPRYEGALRAARKAIRELRRPTQAMVDAATHWVETEPQNCVENTFSGSWAQAIDAASPPIEEK